jgi:L-ascorbate metabolism protein UlaG (beta-lactamase superfamily)
MNSKQNVYLRNNVQVEPLINGWFAWHNLIPPVSSALNVIERNIPIMESYIEDPEIHAECVKNPAMKGGPFIDLKSDRVQDVKALLESTKLMAKPLYSFVKAIRDLDALLAVKADGFKLEPLYSQIPEELRGLVELYYDRHHRPDFRFLEPLIYKSRFYLESSQSIAFSLINNDSDRPFIFSTPRIDEPGVLNIPLPFRSKALDSLFEMKRTPKSFDAIATELNIKEEDLQTFARFFTTEIPKPYQRYDGEHMRVRYFGHACILLETKDVSILIDPVLSYTYDSGISRYTYDDLPDKIDIVLITHGHHDHILLETMLQIRHKVGTIVVGKNIDGAVQDASIKLLYRNLGFHNIMEITELEQLNMNNVVITGIPFMGEHHDLHIASKMCYHIAINGVALLAMADSCNQSPEVYKNIHNIIGDVDVLFLGMECDGAPVSWVYGPLFTNKPSRVMDNSRRGRGSNYNEGIDIVKRFNCKEVYVYAMGEEPWISYILDVHYTELSNPIIQSNQLIRQCIAEGRFAERLFGEKEILVGDLREVTI